MSKYSVTEELVIACFEGNTPTVKTLLGRGGSVNVKNIAGWTPLCAAVVSTRDAVLELILTSKDARIGFSNHSGLTAVHLACRYNYTKTLQKLLAHRSCNKQVVNMVDEVGRTAKMMAKSKGFQECVNIVKEYLDKEEAPAPTPATPACVIPECPVCMEELKPPVQIFNCYNGHLICSSCKPRVTNNRCHCRAHYMGRATAMEQLIRQLLGIV